MEKNGNIKLSCVCSFVPQRLPSTIECGHSARRSSRPLLVKLLRPLGHPGFHALFKELTIISFLLKSVEILRFIISLSWVRHGLKGKHLFSSDHTPLQGLCALRQTWKDAVPPHDLLSISAFLASVISALLSIPPTGQHPLKKFRLDRLREIRIACEIFSPLAPVISTMRLSPRLLERAHSVSGRFDPPFVETPSVSDVTRITNSIERPCSGSDHSTFCLLSFRSWIARPYVSTRKLI